MRDDPPLILQDWDARKEEAWAYFRASGQVWRDMGVAEQRTVKYAWSAGYDAQTGGIAAPETSLRDLVVLVDTLAREYHHYTCVRGTAFAACDHPLCTQARALLGDTGG